MKVNVARTFKKIVKMQYRDGQLWITANYFVSRKRLIQIVEEHIDWVRARQKEHKEIDSDIKAPQAIACAAPLPQQESVELHFTPEFYGGRKILIMGEVLNVCCGFASKPYTEGSKLYLPEQQFGSRDKRFKAIKSYVKKVCNLYIPNEIAEYGSKISMCPAKIEFRELTDGWLKCDLATQKIICLDYRIVQLPQDLRKYIIAHAFAHFYCPAHDSVFWENMHKMLPNIMQCSDKLEQYSYLKNIE